MSERMTNCTWAIPSAIEGASLLGQLVPDAGRLVHFVALVSQWSDGT